MRPNMHTADSPEPSAVVPVPNAESVEIRKNHANMVKFRHSSDDDFKTVVGHLGLMCERTEEKVGSVGKKRVCSLDITFCYLCNQDKNNSSYY